VTIANSTLRNNVSFFSNKAMTDYGTTRTTITGCTFANRGALTLIVNHAPNKAIFLENFRQSGAFGQLLRSGISWRRYDQSGLGSNQAKEIGFAQSMLCQLAEVAVALLSDRKAPEDMIAELRKRGIEVVVV
jgi:hypothetical protein